MAVATHVYNVSDVCHVACLTFGEREEELSHWLADILLATSVLRTSLTSRQIVRKYLALNNEK